MNPERSISTPEMQADAERVERSIGRNFIAAMRDAVDNARAASDNDAPVVVEVSGPPAAALAELASADHSGPVEG